MDSRERLEMAFSTRFGTPPIWIVRAPGRVNLIGEHTDYNQGFVLPAAIDRYTYLALRPRLDDRVVLHSLEREDPTDIRLDTLEHQAPTWGEYVRGVAWALQSAELSLKGWEGILTSEVPIGAGLSSSAALELAVARAFAAVAELPWDPVWMAQRAQSAENEWVGVRSGIMDQLAAACGQAGHALLIDCRTLVLEFVQLPAGVRFAVLDTSTRRDLRDSSYNMRRQECEAAAEVLQIASLREADLPALESAKERLGPTLYRRARHVITENQRTLAAARDLSDGDLSRVGSLFQSSHESLRKDFEVSSPELDVAVGCATAIQGCYGARLTGGGFAGAALALVDEGHTEGFAVEFQRCFRQATGLTPTIHICDAAGGAEVLRGPHANSRNPPSGERQGSD